METRAPDFEPDSTVVHWADSDTLIISLPGFRKEQLKVQLTGDGVLRISGERPAEGNKKSRFRKEFKVPEDCKTGEIKAKFENNALFITMPKPRKQHPPLEESRDSPRDPLQAPETEPATQAVEKASPPPSLEEQYRDPPQAPETKPAKQAVEKATPPNSATQKKDGVKEAPEAAEKSDGAGPELRDSSPPAMKEADEQEGNGLGAAKGSEAGGGREKDRSDVARKWEEWVKAIVSLVVALVVYVKNYVVGLFRRSRDRE